MELKEALEYADTIIKMGKKKGHTSKNIKNSILTYTDILSDEGSITDDDARVLEIVANKTLDIMSGKTTIDEVSANGLKEYYELSSQAAESRRKIKNMKEGASVITACGGGGAPSGGRCGSGSSTGCGRESTPSYSRCGGSSSTGCGSSSSGSRC